ncbi:MAG: CvpA family protein [Bacteroidia bacterium]
MTDLNALDWIIIIVLIIGFVNGFRKGLIMSLSTLIGVVLGIFLAMKGSSEVDEFIHGNTSIDGPILPYISFIAVFAGVYIICYIAGKAMSSAVKLLMLGLFDKVLGGLFGASKALLFVSLVSLMINYFGWSMVSSESENKSRLYSKVRSGAALFYPAIEKVFPDNRPDFLDKLLKS